MTRVERFKKGIAVVLVTLMLFNMLPGGFLKTEAAAREKTTLSISDGSIVISNGAVTQNGVSLPYNSNGYIITGSTTANTLSVTGGSQDITLSGVNIDVSSEDNVCAFSVASGALVNLTLSGSNTLKSSGYHAGLQVPQGASVNITGTGSLTATGGSCNYNYDDSLNGGGAGIGSGYRENCGAITIFSGTVTATGGNDECYGGGAGIGSGNVGLGGGADISGGSITIFGGTVTATGSNGGAGIGGGASASGGSTIISGGKVTANAGVDSGSGSYVGGAGIGGGECGHGGSTIISGGTVAANGGCDGAGIGNGCLSSGGSAVTTTITGGSVKATTVTGNVTDGSGNTEHCVTATGLTSTADVNASINGGKTFDCETDSSGKLYLWMSNGDNKSTICCNGTYYGVNTTVSDANISTATGVMTMLDLSRGDITISDGIFSGKDSNGDAASANTYGYVITASSDVEGQTVSISGGSDSIVLQNVTVDNKHYSISPISVTGTASVYLTLSGNNTLQSFYAGVEVTGDATVSITGTDGDSLNAHSTNYGAGIGGNGDGTDANNCGTVTISGGNITALGAINCAGIGGAYLTTGGRGGNVTISGGTVDAEGGASAAGIGGSGNGGAAGITVTGGTVTAVGSDGGAGIGGGMHESGTVTITGGTVTSTAVAGTLYKHCGSGIGNGHGGSGSTVKISGGSVNTSSISNTPTNDGSTPVYPTTVTLPSGTDVSNLSVKQSNAVSYGTNDIQADSNEKLYLYLPAYTGGDTTINVTAGGTAYRGYHGTVKNTGTQSNPNVLKMDQSALSFADTGTQTFTYGDAIELNKAVTGGTLRGVVSYTYSGKDRLGNTYTDSAACPTNAGDGNYTITATLPGDSSYYGVTAAKNFVISQKNISTSGVAAAVVSATYTGGALSPVITATFGTNTLIGGTDFNVYDGTGNTLDPTFVGAGSYNILVKGAGNYTGSITKAFAIAQKAIALTLKTSQSEAKAGGSVNLTAAVSSGAVNLPAGTVTFKYGSTTIASGVEIKESAGKYTAQTTWSNVPTGEYNITAEYAPADNDNYFCSAAATISGYSITKHDQTGFGFSDKTLTKTYGDDAFTVAASGGQGSGSVTYQSGNTDVAAVTDGGVVTIKSAGTAIITAKKDSDSTYNEAVDTVTINIGKAATSIKKVPAASDITVVGKLSSAALTGGEGNVSGSFSWTNPNTVVSENGEYEVTFTPASSNYSPCTCKVKVTVTPVITNSGTGVQYDLSSASLPDGVTSVSVHSSAVSEAGSGGSAYSVVSKLIDGSTFTASPSEVKLYNLSLMDQKNQAVNGFTGKITVKIPIPSGMSGDLHVYWYNDVDGTVTDMNAKQEKGYLVFETPHFSYYAVAELTENSISGPSPSNDTPSSGSSSNTIPNPNTASDSFPFLPAALLGISGCGMVAAIKGRRRRKKN